MRLHTIRMKLIDLIQFAARLTINYTPGGMKQGCRGVEIEEATLSSETGRQRQRAPGSACTGSLSKLITSSWILLNKMYYVKWAEEGREKGRKRERESQKKTQHRNQRCCLEPRECHLPQTWPQIFASERKEVCARGVYREQERECKCSSVDLKCAQRAESLFLKWN